MKQLLLIVVAVMLCASMLFADGIQPPGSGTEGDKYQVSTLDHLLWISTNIASWGSYFTQTANIDAAATATWDDGNGEELEGFKPIGNETDNFTGSYNGDSHTISNLTINRSSEDYIGLFGVTSSTTISNLSLVNANITGNYMVGSLAGSLNGTMNNCSSSGSVTGYYYVGGLVGCNSSSDVKNSQCSCNVTGSSYYTAGLVGLNNSGLIENCSSTGDVTGVYGVGGFVAYNMSGSILRSCFSTGNISGVSAVGGFSCLNENTIVSNCYSSSSVTRTYGSNTAFGAFIGNSYNGSYEYCYATGSVSCGSETSKGFIGLLSSPCTSTANFFDSQTTGQTTGEGATAKTTEQMTTPATFTDAGWDFEIETTNGVNDYWDMDMSGSYNNGYPFLSWQNGGDVSLPVELSGFSAHCAGQAVVLEWATESETDNLGFILERADDNSTTWQIIASYKTEAALSSRGNTSSHTVYSFTDNTTIAGASYRYRLSDVNTKGSITVHSPLSIVVAALPLTTTLAKAYPNPFNPRTTITWELAADGDVSLTVYDMLGRKVKDLAMGYRSAGSYQATWNGADDSGAPTASGSYLIRLQTGNTTQIQKVMFLK